MKSGLEGRNNTQVFSEDIGKARSLNEVRPRRPEQSLPHTLRIRCRLCLNEVRPRRPEQSTYEIKSVNKGTTSQ